MCFPAARASDYHACPGTTGAVAHVGGPIILGAPTVLIGNLPATRAGDLALCVGSVDAIQTGSATVLIRNKLAARQGDKLDHGGAILTGCPTVFIGGATASVERPEGLPRPDKRYRIRVRKADASSFLVDVPRIPGLKMGRRVGKIYFQILDTETDLQAEFTFEWSQVGVEPGLPAKPDRDRDRPDGNLGKTPGEWVDFVGPDMPLEEFAGNVILPPRPPGDKDLDLVFRDDDSRAFDDDGVIEGLKPGTDFDPDAYPDVLGGIGGLHYEEGSTGPSKGD